MYNFYDKFLDILNSITLVIVLLKIWEYIDWSWFIILSPITLVYGVSFCMLLYKAYSKSPEARLMETLARKGY